MDLTGAVLRVAAARPHVLPAVMPGSTAVRLAAERELRRRGWPVALTPADADVLLVLGTPVPAMAGAVARLARDMPAPRATVHVSSPDQVASALETGRSRLRDGALRGRGGQGGPRGHGGHGESMGMPGGLPMAEQAGDRDGLKLDQLHLSLGPLLGDWPAALTVRVTVQGDVIQEAEIDSLGPSAGGVFWNEPWQRAEAGGRVTTGQAARRRAAGHLDSVARLVGVAGWPAAAMAARRLRDDLLDGGDASVVGPRAARLARRVGRSRTLYWLTRGIAPLSRADAHAAGVRGPVADADGDVPARYRAWLAAVEEDLARLNDGSPLDRTALTAARPSTAGLLRLLPGLLEGAELAAARLTVASLDPDTDELMGAEVSGG
ncbi:hypothetical protein [Streptomyces sp. NPDC018693]|uniref:hypothetical protein n=1 Tax=unclassified Streptomyces TaxID=2593676 RepID=UPI0037937746